MAVVKSKIPHIKLSLAGRGEMTGRLKEQIDRQGLTDCVDLVGFVENRDIYSFISKHHLVVMPSRREGFGVAAIEAGI